MADRADLLVIGAGVIGVTAALMAQARGRRVILIDRSGPAAGASRGNAGGLAFSEIEPMAAPATLRSAPRWLLDPLGPLSVPPGELPKRAPWLLRFALAAHPARVRASRQALAALNLLSRDELKPFLDATGTRNLLRERGHLSVYDRARHFAAARKDWEERGRFGMDCRFLDGAEALATVQPGLHSRFAHGIFTTHWWSIDDPRRYVERLHAAFLARGGLWRVGTVEGLLAGTAGPAAQLAGGETLHAEKILVAAGAWSHLLLHDLGLHIPLDTERGYNTTLPGNSIGLRMPITFEAHGFVTSPIGSGIRVGGAVELGGLERPPHPKRARALLDKARAFLPGLDTSGGTEWMGFRPSLPDSLPVIGPAGPADVFLAFGHGHLGLTQSAGTGRLICDLIDGQTPPVDAAPFRADRF
ncbi:NAD(P)/FAD-dependent oxidoreductase [Pukyongiella litopenaei]|uniref:FAD-dependent oxidoreductase n=1 Tax=Pukyongiella litopenaei TaxID=2605946 RepID=A0A2S0MSR6_9RHOB|nr:FAD-dependent oxidoreductase [Pukyongiella litopenaei]AVO38924.1 FAD-dependent oxidoreductase [Pukyongiella litopenaei]